MSVHVFGEVDGVPVLEISIASEGGATAKILTWGAVVRDLVVPTEAAPQRVVLGLNTLADYLAHSPHMGAIAGRFANRIANGRFELNGYTYQVPQNFLGKHALHGGGKGFGFSVRPWKLVSHTEDSVTLGLHSPDGDAGFPGAMDVTCVYSLVGLEQTILRVDLTATSDKTTIVNLAHHSYFNLDGSADILGHTLTLACDFRTPTDHELIPTGEVTSVTGTPWEFTTAHTIGGRGTLYDGNMMITAKQIDGLAHAAQVHSSKSGVTMDVHTTEPCVQFYDGAKIKCPVPGLGGVMYGAHAGLCLEPQVPPDSPNRRHFTSSVLHPDQEYRQVTEYRFSSI